jgi:phosphate transport system substrate-binding protein
MDQAVIGRVSREFKDNEKGFGLTYLPILKIPVVFFISKNVEVQNLSSQQVCDIYSGKITNWKQVGGKGAEIGVVRREDGDSSLETLQKSFPGFKGIAITPKAKICMSDPETCELVQSKQDVIAFGTYDNAKRYGLKPLTIDGKNPGDSNYPYVDKLALIFKQQNKTGNVAKFVDFVTSREAQDVIKKAGGLSL